MPPQISSLVAGRIGDGAFWQSSTSLPASSFLMHSSRSCAFDSAGTVVPTATDVVHVVVTGGTIVALDNGDMQDHAPYQSSERRAFNGRGLAILRASGPDTLRITAHVDGLPDATLTLVVRPGHAAEAIPAAR